MVLMSPQDKAMLEERARRAGVSIGEFVRRSVEAYDPDARSGEIEAVLDRLEQSREEALAALARAEKELETTEQYFAAKRRRDGNR